MLVYTGFLAPSHRIDLMEPPDDELPGAFTEMPHIDRILPTLVPALQVSPLGFMQMGSMHYSAMLLVIPSRSSEMGLNCLSCTGQAVCLCSGSACCISVCPPVYD
jgi:hypothetical protein